MDKEIADKLIEIRTAHHDELQAANGAICSAVDAAIEKVNESTLSDPQKTEVGEILAGVKPTIMQATTRAMSRLNEHIPNRSEV